MLNFLGISKPLSTNKTEDFKAHDLLDEKSAALQLQDGFCTTHVRTKKAAQI